MAMNIEKGIERAEKVGAKRVCFIGEWYQEQAGLMRQYIISYYFEDNSVEIFDLRNNKIFLRRVRMSQLDERDFFIGSKINVYGRQFDLISYANDSTKKKMDKLLKKMFVILKNSIVDQVGLIFTAFIDSGFQITRALMVKFTAERIRAFLGATTDDVATSVLMHQILAGPTIGVELLGEDAVQRISAMVDPEFCYRGEMPAPLQRIAEDDNLRIGFYYSKGDERVAQDLHFFFDPRSGLEITCVLRDSTLGIVKPHCIKDGKLGKIVLDITNAGFKIVGMRMHLLDRVNCEEFFEVYRGVLPDYISMVAQLCSGPCLALEIQTKDPKTDVYKAFREFCGPMDPEIAQLLRPHTLRARYGIDKSLNAVHCTDLPEDCLMELQYLFKIN